MQHDRYQKYIALLILLSVLAGCKGISDAQNSAVPVWNDITHDLESLGIPYIDHYPQGQTTYARNPWDLHAHDHYLYIGAGNSSNVGPATNAGPVPVIRFDPQINKFETVFSIDDEQIDLFYTFNGELFIPGHDATESWDFGNIYRLKQTQKAEPWIKHRNLSKAIHIYALTWYNGKLFAGGNRYFTDEDKEFPIESTVFVSEDLGKTWVHYALGKQRIYSFMTVGGKLFAIDLPMDLSNRKRWQDFHQSTIPSVFEYLGEEKGFRAREDIRFEQLIPDYQFHHLNFSKLKLVKPVTWRNSTLYIGAIPHNDHQFFPVGLYKAVLTDTTSLGVERIDLPYSGAAEHEVLIWDLMVYDDTLYVLGSYQDDQEWINIVYQSQDSLEWNEAFRFRSPTFARSFERIGKDWYFALGCEIKNWDFWSDYELHPATGTLLRYRYE